MLQRFGEITAELTKRFGGTVVTSTGDGHLTTFDGPTQAIRCAEALRADLTYLAVHPAERGQGYGRTLLALAAAEAAVHPEIRDLRARAHDHARAARALYTRAGLSHCRAVVTYLRDDTEGEA